MKPHAAAIWVGGLALIFAPPSRAALTIDLDYSLDTSGFFSDSTTNGQAARAALQRASQVLGERIVDNLSPISPAAGDTWTTKFTHPGTGAADFAITDLDIPAKTIKVYAGARDLAGSAIGLGGPGGYTGSGSQVFLDALQYRGQSGAQALSPTDFGPWGGSIAFDNTVSWNLSLAGPAAGKNDFFTVALHEMAHVLGFGTSRSWATFRSGNVFTGPKSKAQNDGANVPLYNLESPSAHWQVGTKSPVTIGGALQEAAMSPSIVVGTRKLFTLLDFAGLDDIGWDIARPGDVNADGTVDFTDLVALAQNYNTSEPLMRWSQGDFNYDGSVDFTDLVALARDYNTTGVMASPTDVSGALGASFSEEWAAAQSVAGVPEPGAIAVVGIGGAVLMRRRCCR
jgi:Dockerin type I domain